MTAPNHIVGGFTFTGILASIGGINILQDYRLIPVIVFASLLPDIDHTRSIIGKIFLPVAKIINRRYGHRTITHSLIAWFGLFALVSAFQSNFFPSLKIAQVFGLAYASHIIFDMMTVQGVPLFFPFKKNACVIPGNPQMRLRTSSIRQETMVFCIFIMSAIFMKPLFANGFWTSYNRLFGSLKHIVSEYNKSDDLILVDFVIQHGSVKKLSQGLCLAVSGSSITVLTEDKKLEVYPKDGQLISDLYPTHTGKMLEFRKGQFLNINLDSFQNLFTTNKFSKIDLHANGSFIYNNNGVEVSKQELNLDYPNRMIIKEVMDHTITEYVSNPAIATKRSEIISLQTRQQVKVDEYNNKLKAYNAYRELMEAETDEVKKELLMIGLTTMKAPKKPSSITSKIENIEATIKQLKTEDYNKYQLEIKKNMSEPLQLSGSYEMILIDGKPVNNEFDYTSISPLITNQITDE